MVLQSYLQYRSFGSPDAVERYRARYEKLKAILEQEKGEQKETSDVSGQASLVGKSPRPAIDQRSASGQSGFTSLHTAQSQPLSGSQQQPEASEDARASSQGSDHDVSSASTQVQEAGRNKSHSQDLPGNIVGERVEMGIREKARATPALGTTDKEEEDPFLVTWEQDDGARNPHSWPWWSKRWPLVGFLTQLGFVVGAAASIDSSAADQAAQVFGVSTEVIELQTAVFLIGFGLSAPFLGSLSELGGRNPVYVLTLLPFILFEIGSALAPNIQTRVILRFLGGFFGSAPLSNSGGSLADVFSSEERTFVFPIFANAGFLGPVLGPTIGGYLGAKLGQAWCDWLIAIYGSALLLAVIALMPETYAPVLLRMKAAQIRRVTGDNRFRTALEKEREKVPFKRHFRHIMALPFLYLVYEPIVLLTSLYMSMCYILLFGYFEAFPLIFQPFGLNIGEIGLTFISVAIGLCLTTALTPLVYSRYKRRTQRCREKKREDGRKDWESALPPPEERLITTMILTWLLPIGLFYQAWTSFPSLPVWPCISAGIIVGAGLLAVFISSYQYVIDVYQAGSATALGTLTFTRYIVSGGTVMFTRPMYKSLGNQWALSLLAFLSIPFCFIPWFFYFYGKRIRSRSRFAPATDDE